MSITATTMTWEALVNAIAAASTYSTIQEAVNAGIVVIEGSSAVGGLVALEGGAGTAVVSSTATALEVAQTSQLIGTATKASTGAITLAKTTGGFKLAGLATMSLPAVAAAAAPIAGVNLGANLYLDNPALWTKISATLLPFCYAENKIQAFVDFIRDPITSKYSPIVTIPTAIINALKGLFDKEVKLYPTVTVTDSIGRSVTGSSPESILPAIDTMVDPIPCRVESVTGSPMVYPYLDGKSIYVYGGSFTVVRANGSYPMVFSDRTYHVYANGWGIGSNAYDPAEVLNDPQVVHNYPPTAGVSAPTTPVVPEVWPDTPIIIVPDPLGPDYQPIPVTPIVPMLPPHEDPIPLPEHVDDPTPEETPEDWPDDEPWPSIIPAPWTEPGPNTPYIPWPLPPKKPDEDTPKPDWWPNYPPSWPEEWPDDEPWPASPDDWPLEAPWPSAPPEWWPDNVPWPTSPYDWPDEVPWPLPPIWPFPWPDNVPYPWPFPYPWPYPDLDPYPDPHDIPDPDERVDPIIDPWPWRIPDPDLDPDPDPTKDASQPDPRPDPWPYPDPDEDDDPPPPSGTIDPSDPPIIPLPFSSTAGLISVYHPSQSELLAFSQWLWVTWQDATIDKIWNNPFDGIISLFELYCTPTDVGRKNIRSGFLDSGVSSETISRYTEIDCGSIGVPEYYGDYLDYAPYSKCHIYLPFIGIVELNVDDIVGHGVNVTYRIDEYNGSCIAMITVAKSTLVNGTEVEYSNIMYQFSGNCAVDLPIAGGSQAAIKAGMLEAAAWGLGSVIGGIMGGSSPLEIGSDMAQGAASAVHSLVSAKSSVQHSGSFGSSFGALGNKNPFIIVTRPKQIRVPNYQRLYGYPAHKMVIIGECTGYLRCREVHVISPTASDEEKTLIEQMLKEGVYITE